MRRIFLVEDEAVVALELKDHLLSLGYEVCGHAARGRHALRQIPETRPDLVLMDINLGAGMTGLDVAEQLRELVDVPVIFLTAYSDAELTQRASLSGSFAYLAKPFEPRVLGANIELALARHQAERAIRESEERYRRAEARFSGVFELAPDALLIVDGAGRIVLANRQAEQTLGYSREQLFQLTVEDLIPEVQRAVHVDMRRGFLAHDRPSRMGSARSRLQALRQDGRLIPVEVSLGPLHWEQDRMVVAAIRDVSERVEAEDARARLERELLKRQKMESLGTFASGIAHDFGNLVSAIKGSVEMAREEGNPEGPVAESLDYIAMASTQAIGLVKQIMAFSRQQPIHRSVASVRAVVEDVARLLRATLPAGIRIVTCLSEDLPSVCIDPTQIHRVVMNLGTNAWHAIERPTGDICLRLDAVFVTATAPPAPGMEEGRYARLQVSDDGKGMDAATLERIFEPFFTTKGTDQGTGLGLAVVHGIVAEHGGAISVESTPGQGTTFFVYLPEA